MRRYRFNLEALLRHRRFVEEVRQKELAQAEQQLALEKEHLEILHQRREGLQSEMAHKLRRGVAAGETALYHRFQVRLDRQIEHQQQRVATAIAERDRQRAALTEAMQQKKKMEKLKAKGLQQFRRKLTQAELKAMDEASVLRFARQKLNQS